MVINEEGKKVFFEEHKLEHSTTPEELLMEIEAVMAQKEVLQTAFSDISVVYATPTYGLVPTALFNPTKASEYLKFNTKILANDFIAHDTLEDVGISVVYVPFVNINNFFFEKYGSFNYYHSISIFLRSLLPNEKYTLPRMYLHFHKNNFDCLILKEGKLQLCNTYGFNTPEDFIYFTLFSMEQLNLNPETLPVFLCGDIDKKDPTYEIAYTYIRNLEFLKTTTISDKDTQEDPHRHFIINNIY